MAAKIRYETAPEIVEPSDSLASMTEPHDPRARRGSADKRTADFFTSAEQFVDVAVFHRSVAVAHGLFATCDGTLDDFEVFLGKGHISVSSGNRWWNCGVEG